ncbi:MAG: primosomal protein N' (replication factor Y) (superfamily II helicase) [Parcubacteria bacterium C7867-008]|nr:MAG: primosomal protein N' (replication factor Y) (superfamily II helicase) [Parcubacteria bacterium C7867-008]
MYVVDVIPFSRTAPAGTLTYRSRTALTEGTIVEVSLRRRMVQGLVVSCQSVAEAKATLKNATFVLTKSVPTVMGTLPESLRTAAERTAQLHASTLGSTLGSLFGEHIRSDLSFAEIQNLHEGSGFAVNTVEMPVEERIRSYTDSISRTQHPVLLVVPTIAETEYWKQCLAKYKPVVLSSTLVGQKREAALHAASSASLVISTPSFSWTPIQNLGTIIVERAGAGSYRSPKRPYLDMRVALTELARARSINLAYGDFPLPLEYRPDPAAPLTTTDPSVTILDMRREKLDTEKPKAVVEEETKEEQWMAVPQAMRDEIAKTLDTGGRVLALAVRRGYAPSVVCRDCGTTRVDEFGNVLTFTKEGPHGRAFRTVDGRILENTNVLCELCKSWNLMPLGVGVERVEEELRAAFPDATVIRFDGDTVRTLSMAKKALVDAPRPCTIVVGTEGAVPWIRASQVPQFDLVVIASADSLLALPFWRARERFVRLAYTVVGMTERLLLGTRLPEDTAVDAVLHPQTTSFFTEETALRSALHYPPFGTLISIQAEATRNQLDALGSAIRSAIGTHSFTVLPDRPLTRTMLRRSYVLHLSEGIWPNQELHARLRTLPPSVRILIDPEAF